jgi:hypothetical protein
LVGSTKGLVNLLSITDSYSVRKFTGSDLYSLVLSSLNGFAGIEKLTSVHRHMINVSGKNIFMDCNILGYWLNTPQNLYQSLIDSKINGTSIDI